MSPQERRAFIASVALAAVITSPQAFATAQRTFVASSGADANPLAASLRRAGRSPLPRCKRRPEARL